MNSAAELKKILEKEKSKKVFLVFQDAYEKSGAKEKFSEVLHSYDVETFSDIRPNPTLEQIENGIKAFRDSKADMVIAIGGGSVIDTAKALNLLTSQKADPIAYIKKEKKIASPGKPLIAIPTTAGTGAEVTRFASVYIDSIKYSLQHEFLTSTYAIIDSELTYSMPPRITAETGMDALAQCIESFWSTNTTKESKCYSKEGISLILPNFISVVNNPTPKAREAMAQGAHLSGKAINIAQTTACHSLSYPFTAHYNIPHGHAVALTLPEMIEYNAKAMKQEDAQELVSLLGAKTPTQAAGSIREVMKEVGLQTKLRELGITDLQQIQDLVLKEVNQERLSNNPRTLDPPAICAILTKIF